MIIHHTEPPETKKEKKEEKPGTKTYIHSYIHIYTHNTDKMENQSIKINQVKITQKKKNLPSVGSSLVYYICIDYNQDPKAAAGYSN